MRKITTALASVIATAAVAGSIAAGAQDIEPDTAGPTEFTSDYAWSHQPSLGEHETLADGTRFARDVAWQFRGIGSSDPRFEGTLTLTESSLTFPGGATITVGANRIENDGGAWQEMPGYWITWDPHPGDTWERAYVGEGGYEGLIAIVIETWRPDGGSAATDIRVEGVVAEADLPPEPEPWVER